LQRGHCRQELHVEVKRRLAAAGHQVPRQQQRFRVQHDVCQAALLGCLAKGGGFEVAVARLEMSARLQPASDLGVQGQQDLSLGRRADQGARRQMSATAVP
jgi:hypothetical protein